MEGAFISLASSLERETLERLEKYLGRHGVACWAGPAGEGSERYALFVPESEGEKARRILQGIVLSEETEESEEPAEEIVEIRCDDEEREAIAAWLQSLLDEHDEDGTHIFFYRPQYENLLDALRASGRAEISVFLLRGLEPFLPEASRRLMMSPALREFFQLVDVVSQPDAE